jgi:HEAT repeat protein
MRKFRNHVLILLLAAGCGKGSTSDWIAKLKAPQSMTRIQAIHTLLERKSEAEQVVPALIEALQDENVYVRRDAARALGSFGEQAKPAIPALQAALKDRESSVRSAAAASLARIDPTLKTKTPRPKTRGQ